jgi:hypothetical protein
MDQLKQTIAAAALDGAIRGIEAAIGGNHTIVTSNTSALERMVRVRPKEAAEQGFMSGGPRYFVVKVSEPI